MSNRYPETKFNAILGFSSNAWIFYFTASKASRIRNISRNQRPKIHSRFNTRDLFFHICADRQVLCYELGSIINEQLGKVTYPIDEVHGFRYFDGRAIIGFVDGTENPEPVIAAQWALVGNEDPDFIGEVMHLSKIYP